MCRLVLAVKDEQKNYPDLTALVELQYPGMKTQKDGCGAMVVKADGSYEVNRSLKDYDSVMTWLSDRMGEDSKMFALHTRYATSGGVSDNNVHFFEDKGVYIAHNGWLEGSKGRVYVETDRDTPIYSAIGLSQKEREEGERIEAELDKIYAILEKCKACYWEDGTEYKTCGRHTGERNRIMKLGARISDLLESAGWWQNNYPDYRDNKAGFNNHYQPREEGMVDTLEFLKAIERPVTKESIGKAMEETAFTGMAFIFDSNTKRAFTAIRKKKVYLTKLEGCASLFSFAPELSYKATLAEELYGLPGEFQQEHVLADDSTMSGVEDGVYEIDYGLKDKKK